MCNLNEKEGGCAISAVPGEMGASAPGLQMEKLGLMVRAAQQSPLALSCCSCCSCCSTHVSLCSLAISDLPVRCNLLASATQIWVWQPCYKVPQSTPRQERTTTSERRREKRGPICFRQCASLFPCSSVFCPPTPQGSPSVISSGSSPRPRQRPGKTNPCRRTDQQPGALPILVARLFFFVSFGLYSVNDFLQLNCSIKRARIARISVQKSYCVCCLCV